MCCYQGKIALPNLEEPPRELMEFYIGQDPMHKKFCKYICKYNNAFAFTSVGRQIDYSVNNRGGSWVFKMYGELIYQIGSLLP